MCNVRSYTVRGCALVGVHGPGTVQAVPTSRDVCSRAMYGGGMLHLSLFYGRNGQITDKCARITDKCAR